MSDGKVEYTLSLKDMLTAKLHEADEAAEQLETTMGMVEKTLGALGIGFAIFEGIEFFKGGIEKAHELHTAEVALQNTMENMGTYSEEAFEKMVNGAKELSKGVLYSTADIVKLQSQLGLVGSIGEEEMQRITKVSADLATKLTMDIGAAGNMLAKAINAPEMLRSLGKQLKIDPSVQEHLQDLAKNGHEAQARLELLAIVEGKVKNAAEEAFNADPLAQFNKDMGAAQKTIGEIGLEILTTLKPILTDISKGFKDGAESVKTFIHWLRENKAALDGVKVAVSLTLGVFALYEGYLAAIAIKSALASAATFVQSIAVFGLAGAFEYVGISATVMWGAITLGASVVIGLLVALYEHSFRFQAMMAGVGAFVGGVFETLGHMAMGFFHILEDILTGKWNKVGGDFGGIISAAEEGFTKAAIAGNNAYTSTLANLNKEAWDKKKVVATGKEGKAGAAGAIADIAPDKAKGAHSITVTMNINKMIDHFSVNSTTVGESAAKIKELVANTLLQAGNDAIMRTGGHL